MTTKSRRATTIKATSEELDPPAEVRDAPDKSARGPVAHVTASPQEIPLVPALVGSLDSKIRSRRAESLMAKGEAFSLAAQLESLSREFEAKRGELQRAWDKIQRRIRVLDAAIDADEATLTFLLAKAPPPSPDSVISYEVKPLLP